MPGYIASKSIQDIRAQLARTAWCDFRSLSAAEARGLQHDATSHGLRAEVVRDGLDDPAIDQVLSLQDAHRAQHPSGSRYRVRIKPSFDDAVSILVMATPEGASVAVGSVVHAEHVPIPHERLSRLRDELASVSLLTLRGSTDIGLDGTSVSGSVEEGERVNHFFVWSPSAEKNPGERTFVVALARLAMEVCREPSVRERLRGLQEWIE
ncbi:hypothetical protein NVS55_22525 [Myxococcus stipitatus]|uniref:hypothetical protein n=1 Tax=Myxococcus stipitatus TaxID=83455 RepID=UPI003144F6DC